MVFITIHLFRIHFRLFFFFFNVTSCVGVKIEISSLTLTNCSARAFEESVFDLTIFVTIFLLLFLVFTRFVVFHCIALINKTVISNPFRL